MSIEIYAALAPEVAETAAAEPATSQWIETAIAVVFTASAVSLVSFIAVITVLVSAGASLRVQWFRPWLAMKVAGIAFAERSGH